MNRERELSQLARKYLEATATPEEQRALAEMLAQTPPTADPTAESVRAMLDYFEKQSAATPAHANFAPSPAPRRAIRRMAIAATAAAAASLLWVALSPVLQKTPRPEASCAWVDGVRIDDPEQIEQIFLQVMARAGDRQTDASQGILTEVGRALEKLEAITNAQNQTSTKK